MSHKSVLVDSQNASLWILYPHQIAGVHHVSRGHSVWQIPHSASPLTPLLPYNLGNIYVLHEYADVFDVVSLTLYGCRSELNGSARKNQVVINCEYREDGIGFTNVTNFSLSGITWSVSSRQRF